MYEPKTHPPISRPEFARRMFRHFAISVGLLVVSLGGGIIGYAVFIVAPVAHRVLHKFHWDVKQ